MKDEWDVFPKNTKRKDKKCKNKTKTLQKIIEISYKAKRQKKIDIAYKQFTWFVKVEVSCKKEVRYFSP